MDQLGEQGDCVRVQAKLRLVDNDGGRGSRLQQGRRQAHEANRSVRQVNWLEGKIAALLPPFEAHLLLAALLLWAQQEVIEERRDQADRVPYQAVARRRLVA